MNIRTLEIPLTEEQATELAHARRMLPDSLSLREAENWRKIRAAIIKYWDDRRDAEYPGWRAHK